MNVAGLRHTSMHESPVHEMPSEKVALLESKTDSDGTTELGTDEALMAAGGWSWYQRRLMLHTGLAMAVLSSHMLMPIFLIPLLHEAWSLSAVERGLISSVRSQSDERRPRAAAAFSRLTLSRCSCFLNICC